MVSRADLADDAPLQRLLSGLPASVCRAVEWLQRPSATWVRIPLAVALILGGCAGFLPILGFWMLPLGVMLLAEDLPFLRRPAMLALGAAQRWWDRREKRA